MVSGLYMVVGAALVLGVMILVHEFGHFAAAKLCGVRVEVFSIGFGKRLIGFRRGETDYRISALPFGGYVKMTGVNAVEMPEEKSAGDDPEEFLQHPRWQRLIIAFAGPVSNLVLAVVMLTAVLALHHEVPWGYNKPAVVGAVLAGSAAEQAGIKEGDRIVQVGDESNPLWKDVANKVLVNPGQAIPLKVQRAGELLTLSLTPKSLAHGQIGDAGFAPSHPLQVTILEKGLPGEQAGLQLGDEIVNVDGVAIRSTIAMQAHLQVVKDTPVHLDVIRQGRHVSLTVQPRLTQVDPATKLYRIGFASDPMEVDQLPLQAAVPAALEDCRKESLMVFDLVGRLVERKASMKQVSGPIEMVRISGEVVRTRSLNELMQFMSLISLQLGLFNLLPIPILDGGLIAMLVVESVMRRDIHEGIKIRLYQAAFVCLVLLMGFVIFNDVVKLLPGQ